MDEKRIAEIRKFVCTVTDPRISAFIDVKKLCKSGMYDLSVKMAIEHAATHGDFGYLNNLLGLLEGTTDASELIFLARTKLNFVLTGTTPRKFKKASPEQVAKAAKQLLQKPRDSKTQITTPSRKTATPKASTDLLDSRLMLPGSYGHGKRR